MSTLIVTLIAVLSVWMLICAWCGYRNSFGLFVAVLLGGLVINMAWMMIGLDARMLERHALVAQGAAGMYGLCAFCCGWFAGRIARAWKDSRVEDIGV